MWCARFGHLECGIVLAHWCPGSLLKRDVNGQNAVQIATSHGFTKFGTELERVQGLLSSGQLLSSKLRIATSNASAINNSSSSGSEGKVFDGTAVEIGRDTGINSDFIISKKLININ